jgi:hypothetical protein
MDDLVVTVRYIPTNFDSQNVRRIFLGGLNNPRLPIPLEQDGPALLLVVHTLQDVPRSLSLRAMTEISLRYACYGQYDKLQR